MEPYVSRDRNKKGELRLRQRWECKPCTATKKRIGRLRKLGRLDELEQAIEAGEHSRAARIRANSGQVLANPSGLSARKRRQALTLKCMSCVGCEDSPLFYALSWARGRCDGDPAVASLESAMNLK